MLQKKKIRHWPMCWPAACRANGVHLVHTQHIVWVHRLHSLVEQSTHLHGLSLYTFVHVQKRKCVLISGAGKQSLGVAVATELTSNKSPGWKDTFSLAVVKDGVVNKWCWKNVLAFVQASRTIRGGRGHHTGPAEKRKGFWEIQPSTPAGDMPVWILRMSGERDHMWVVHLLL